MKKIFRNYRYYVLFVLCTISMLALLAVPMDELPTACWFYTLITSKLIALLTGWMTFRLTKHWEKAGKIPELIELINEL